MQNNRFQSDKTQDFLNQANDWMSFLKCSMRHFWLLNSTRSFSTVFKSRSHICLFEGRWCCREKKFPIEDPNFMPAWLGFRHSRHIFILLFTDIGSRWLKSFILDYAFLRFVRNISFYIGIIYANVRLSWVSEIPQNQYQGNKRCHTWILVIV